METQGDPEKDTSAVRVMLCDDQNNPLTGDLLDKWTAFVDKMTRNHHWPKLFNKWRAVQGYPDNQDAIQEVYAQKPGDFLGEMEWESDRNDVCCFINGNNFERCDPKDAPQYWYRPKNANGVPEKVMWNNADVTKIDREEGSGYAEWKKTE
ncbi:MAG: hypothetical protein Q9159_003122 [Coniocarpon cinnabarinum]